MWGVLHLPAAMALAASTPLEAPWWFAGEAQHSYSLTLLALTWRRLSPGDATSTFCCHTLAAATGSWQEQSNI
jgi:hypothetical protein